jgi:hypothetical protein
MGLQVWPTTLAWIESYYTNSFFSSHLHYGCELGVSEWQRELSISICLMSVGGIKGARERTWISVGHVGKRKKPEWDKGNAVQGEEHKEGSFSLAVQADDFWLSQNLSAWASMCSMGILCYQKPSWLQTGLEWLVAFKGTLSYLHLRLFCQRMSRCWKVAPNRA